MRNAPSVHDFMSLILVTSPSLLPSPCMSILSICCVYNIGGREGTDEIIAFCYLPSRYLSGLVQNGPLGAHSPPSSGLALPPELAWRRGALWSVGYPHHQRSLSRTQWPCRAWWHGVRGEITHRGRRLRLIGPGGGHWGGHCLFEVGYQLRNYSPPLFGIGKPLVLLSPNLQPPIFTNTQEQPLEISIKWEFSALHMSYFTKLLY